MVIAQVTVCDKSKFEFVHVWNLESPRELMRFASPRTAVRVFVPSPNFPIEIFAPKVKSWTVVSGMQSSRGGLGETLHLSHL